MNSDLGDNISKFISDLLADQDSGVIGGYCEDGFPLFYANEKMAHMLGYDNVDELAAGIEGMVANTIHPDDMAHVVSDLGTEYYPGLAYKTMYRMPKKDGSWFWTVDRGKVIETEDGRLAILNVCTNLSAFIEERDKLVQQIEQVYCEKIQKQQEYEKVNQEQFRVIEALSTDYTCLFLIDPVTDKIRLYRETNAAIGREAILKLTALGSYTQFVDAYVKTYVAPDDRERMRQQTCLAAVQANADFDHMYKVGYCLQYPGYSSYFEANFAKTEDAANNVVYVLAYRNVNDEVQQQLAEAKVREQNQEIIEGLGSEYYSVLLVDCESDKVSYHRAAGDDGPDIADSFVKFADSWSQGLEYYADEFVAQHNVAEFREKLSLEYLQEHSKDYSFIYEKIKNGQSMFLEARVAFVQGGSGNIAVVGTRNVDELIRRERMQEKALQEAVSNLQTEQKLMNMRVRTMSEGIHGGFKRGQRDKLFTINYVSKQLAEMLGYSSPMEMIRAGGGNMAGLVDIDEVRPQLPEADRMVDKGEMFTMTYKARCKDGSWKTVEEKGRLITNLDGSQEFWSFITDKDELTKKAEALAAAQKANAALEKAQQDLQIAREKADAASEAKSTFLFNMSHDIRTPMNAILGYTELLGRNFGDAEKCLDYIEKIKSSGNFLLSLINNVLEMARIESGKSVLDEVPVESESVAQDVIGIYSDIICKKNITFNNHLDFKEKYLYCDTVKLKEIFLNILSNAYKYTPEGGTITITCRELPCDRDGYVYVETSVADTGIGMSEEFQKVLFEAFVREHNSEGNTIEGTGLGMPIVKRLVELMEGSIHVESKLGQGSTFTVTIPHRIADKSMAEPEQTKAKIDTSRFAGKRILLAEDNDLNAEIAMELLHWYDLEVDRAADGIECVDMLQKAEPGYYDLILMDIQMPNMNGYKATHAIRHMECPKRASIPIVAMTANAFAQDKQDALDAGMNDHLAKPIVIESFMAMLDKYL